MIGFCGTYATFEYSHLKRKNGEQSVTKSKPETQFVSKTGALVYASIGPLNPLRVCGLITAPPCCAMLCCAVLCYTLLPALFAAAAALIVEGRQLDLCCILHFASASPVAYIPRRKVNNRLSADRQLALARHNRVLAQDELHQRALATASVADESNRLTLGM